MRSLELEQAAAIANMGRSVPDYNEGVLAMLGKGELARNYKARKAELDDLVAAQGARASDDTGLENFLEPTKPEILDARARLERAWAPIQEIIDDAQRKIAPIMSEFLP